MRRTGWTPLAYTAAVALCLLGSPSWSASPRAIAALEADPHLAYAPDAVLVRFQPGLPAPAAERARVAVGGRLRPGIPRVPGLEVLDVPPGQVARVVASLRRLPEVLYAEPDYVVRPSAVIPNDVHFGLQWGFNSSTDGDVNAPEAWVRTVGFPETVVAVIDSGVQWDHPDLAGNMWVNAAELNGLPGVDDDGNGFVDDIRGWDFYSKDNNPMDEHGHGTHVAGTIGATGNNGTGVAGMAWRCGIMPLRFLGPNGGYTSDAVAALDYAVSMGARISNNSWGGGGYSTALYDAIARARSRDHLFVAAAGNNGSNNDATPFYPASYQLDNIVSVAAVTKAFALATFSNYGATRVHLAAPGVDIVSTYTGNSYAYMSGTSMAAPHVAGVAVLVRGLYPGWDYVDVKDRLLRTVRPVAALSGVTVTGGVVDAAAAVTVSVSLPAAPSGLAASAISSTAIALTWEDNAADEQGFELEFATGNDGYVLLAVLPPNTTSHTDTGLTAGTTYTYRIRAFNDAGASLYSDPASAATAAAPAYVDTVASGEIAGSNGGITGAYQSTWASDGSVQSIKETLSGGAPAKRYSILEHTWVFSGVPAGDTVSLHVQALTPASTDGDRFVFAYSADGTSYANLFETSASGEHYAAYLPTSVQGTVYIRVRDTNRTAGSTSLDTISVDHLFLRTWPASGSAPAAPSGLTATAVGSSRVDLAWTDTAADESGFLVERSAGDGPWEALATVAADVTVCSDLTVAGNTTYAYRVRAFNGAGSSDFSNVAEVRTEQSIVLTARGYKVRSVPYAELSWAGASTDTVDVYRNGTRITTVPNTGSYTDAIGGKGGTWTYQVCEPGGRCSNTATVSF